MFPVPIERFGDAVVFIPTNKSFSFLCNHPMVHLKANRFIMKTGKTCLLALLAFVVSLAPLGVSAQSPPFRFERLSLEEGVSHNLVYAIQQDRTGYMWFGTMYGLVKFDGRRYTTFKHDPTDSTSLSYNDVITIHEDRDNNLWIGTWGGGLNRFDPRTEKFTRYLHRAEDEASLGENTVWAICEDHTGAIWVGHNQGADRLTFSATKHARFEHFTFPLIDDSTRRATVRDIFEDSKKRLWLGTSGGGLVQLVRQQNAERFLVTQKSATDSTALAGNAVNVIYEDAQNRLYFGTEAGLYELVEDQVALKFRRWQSEPARANSLSNNHIEQTIEDGAGNLWVGTAHGLNRINAARTQIERIFARPRDPHGLTSNNIVALCRDQAGLLWIGTYYGGVHTFDPRGSKFESIRYTPGNDNGLANPIVRAITQDRSGTLWLGTFGGGLTALTNTATATPQYTHYRFDPQNTNTLSSNAVTALYEDHEETLWIATRNAGLNALDRSRQRVQRFLAAPEGLLSNALNCVYEDRNGELWIGTDGSGLNRLDRTRKKFTRYQNDPQQARSLSNDYVNTIYEDRRGALWFGTFRGLNRFDPSTQTFQNYRHQLNDHQTLSNDYVFSIYEDHAGNFWVGTSDGLNLFDRTTGKSKAYYEKSGLPNGVIYGILEDESGRLWLSTLKGLSCFNPQTETFENFDATDGLQSNMFNLGACFKSASGTLYFGSMNGCDFFTPTTLPRNTFVPPVVISSVSVFDQPRLLSRASALQLRHSENFLRFEFAALSYAHTEKNRFAYRLEGLEEEWNETGTRNFASYTDLQPGEYTLRVKAANHDGVWNEAGTSLQIIVAPPFWRTWWFYGFVTASVLALLYTWHRMRLQRERERLAEIARIKHEERFQRFQAVEQARQEERERVRKKIAADFHDESGHKITKIALFCGVLQSKLKGRVTEVEEYLERIIKMAASLHKDMSDFIWSLDPEEDTLHDTALKLKDFGDKLFDHTDIRFQLEGLAPELEQAHLPMETRQNVTCIFKEGMNNILKHSRASCRNVVFSLKRNNGTFALRLRDDGEGFDLEHCTLGRGLRNMQERARAIGGELRIISTLGIGTEIQFLGKMPQAQNGWNPEAFEPWNVGVWER